MSKIPEHLRTWVEIDTKAIRVNFKSFEKIFSRNQKKMIVVKSNAYGHDMTQFAKFVSKLGVDFFGVDSFEEALELRNVGIKESILVFGYTPSVYFAKASEEGISITISSIESLAKVCNFNGKNKLKIHIKADTGLHRQGFSLIQANDVAMALLGAQDVPPHRFDRCGGVLVEGIYTHLATAETPKYSAYTDKQISKFWEWVKIFITNGFEPIVHASASAASILYKDMRFDMARVGISIYGLWASKETKSQAKQLARLSLANSRFNLRPVLSWKAVVSEVKAINKNERVGYDLTEKVHRDSVMAVLPVGYWHGYPRNLSSCGEVLINGKRAKVIGRVSMDMIVVDVTGIKGVKQGTIATLIGRDKKDEITAEELALKAGTINYEIVTRINAQIPRIMK